MRQHYHFLKIGICFLCIAINSSLKIIEVFFQSRYLIIHVIKSRVYLLKSSIHLFMDFNKSLIYFIKPPPHHKSEIVEGDIFFLLWRGLFHTSNYTMSISQVKNA